MIKLGPFKVTEERWRRIQLLPGRNDEHRFNLALDFALEHMEAMTRKKAEVDAQVMRIVEEERAKQPLASAVPGPLPPDGHPDKTCGPECHHDADGNGFTVEGPGVPLPPEEAARYIFKETP